MEAVALAPVATEGTTARLVLVFVAGHWNSYTGTARPGTRRLAVLAGCHHTTAARALHKLVDNGDLAVVEPARGKRPAVYAVRSLGPASGAPIAQRNGAASGAPRAQHKEGDGEPLRSASGAFVERSGRNESRSRSNNLRAREERPGPANPTTSATEIAARLEGERATPEVVDNALASARRAIGRQ